MKRFPVIFFLIAFVVMGCSHIRTAEFSSPSINPILDLRTETPVPGQSGPIAVADSGEGRFEVKQALEITSGQNLIENTEGDISDESDAAAAPEDETEQATTIADPLEKFNRAMFTFNDKLYFWVLKPVAEGYKNIVPETPRVSVNNFFTNLGFPIRFINFLLQADFSGAAAEFGRFAVNTVWGIGGLMDPASSKQLEIPKKDADFGQTLGMYGVGQGFYIVWPFIGPSSARDTVDIAGSYVLYPVYYLNPWYAATSVRAYEEVNETSLRLGDYESLKEAAIDPYVALRDAYAQYREQKVEAAKGKAAPTRPGGVRVGKDRYRYFSILEELIIQEGRHEKQKS